MMKVHEYQAKQIISQYGIPVPRGGVAGTPEEAEAIARDIGGPVVIKAQIHAGGRGKAGGIRQAASPEEAARLARELLGSRLVTFQTTPQGLPVNRVLVEEALDVEQELYLGIVIDGQKGMPVVIASAAGGMEIEEVARESPEKVARVAVDPAIGFQPFLRRRLAYALGLSGNLFSRGLDLMDRLFRVFMEKDCSLAEINPLVVARDGRLLALDVKLNFDDNALFRHPELEELRDRSQEDPLELEALSLGLRNYIKLDGNIGCMVNGAGLAMAVLDLVTAAGGRPANFLDIGTLNTTERVVNAFKVFLADPDVKGVLINIFGGMARVDVIARGLVEAYRTMNVNIPVVVRLAGTNVEEGRQILAEAGLPIIEAQDLADAAGKAVAAVKGG